MHRSPPQALARLVSTPISIGRTPRAPKPHAEAPVARQTAMLAFAFFAASALYLASSGVSLGTLGVAFPLYALGGFCILIFGTSRLLLAGMAGRDMVGGFRSALVTSAPTAIGAGGLFLVDASSMTARTLLAMIWAIGPLAHVTFTLLTVRRSPTRPVISDPTATKSPRWPIRALELTSLIYGAASAVFVPLAYAGVVTLSSALHVVLVGFVITTIMSTAVHILPRFTRVPAPPTLVGVLAPFALIGPALMAAGLDRSRDLVRAGALVEGVAFALFGVAVVLMMVRAHKFRWPNLAYAAAPVTIAIGGLLALSYALTGSHAELLAVHGVLNVYGFVGLFVIAASSDIYGPALGAGAKPAKRHAWIAMGLVFGGLVFTAIGVALAAGVVGRIGMLVYAGGLTWQLVGIGSAHVRAGRVMSNLRTGSTPK